MVNRDFKKATLFTVLRMTFVLMLVACAPHQPDSAPQALNEPEEVARVSLEEARAAYDKNEALFLDVRSTSSYASSHIPGARSIPLADLESRMGDLDPSQWIITYCT
jgi:3-mercaptopyruvate sulfurtransferase SseA